MASANVKEFTDGNFESEVLNSSEPVLVDFWAEWCMLCRRTRWRSSRSSGRGHGKVKVGKVDTDGNRDISMKFGINAIPHYFTIDSDGVLTAEMIGTGYDVERRLKKLIAQTKEKQAPAETASATPGS